MGKFNKIAAFMRSLQGVMVALFIFILVVTVFIIAPLAGLFSSL